MKVRFRGVGLRRSGLLISFSNYKSLSEEIVRVWLPHAQNQDQIWQSHQDINDVMLATALIPEMFLSVGERVPYDMTEDRQME